MRRARTAIARVTAAAATVLVLAGCYPPSQTPTTQPIPPGGHVVAAGPALTQMWIQDASDDLSTILYGRGDFTVDDRPPYRYWVYDDETRTTVEVPMGSGDFGGAALSPDERQVVLWSNDRRLQVGPTAANCEEHPPWQPVEHHMCDELYLFDLDTGERRQLTGLDGSSDVTNQAATFTDDGTAVIFSTHVTGLFVPIFVYHRLDLATGEISDADPPPAPTSWDRGSHVVAWDDATATLTSTDEATGEVATLWADDLVPPFGLASSIDDGRLIVLSRYPAELDQVPAFRLIDTDTRTIRTVMSKWISRDGRRFAVVQLNVLPDATDRLVIAPLPA